MIETGVLFDDIHSFRDLNLVLAPFVLPPAKPKTDYIDVPGRDGSIDATEATGKVTYKDREFSFTFTVFPEDTLTFEERQTVVSNALNGKRCKITLDKDPDYYLEGRCTVEKHFANKKLRQIVVGVRCAPYKMKKDETVVSFTVEPGYGNEKTIYLQNSKKQVVPTIEVSGSVTITVNGSGVRFYAGTHKDLDLCLHEGSNTLRANSTNDAVTVKVSYREGDL